MSDNIQEGDNVCRSCTGLLIYTKERNRRGEAPLCIGVPGVAKGRIPKDKLTELNEKTKVKSKDLGTYICLGYSQWSGMMERTGTKRTTQTATATIKNLNFINSYLNIFNT